MGDTSTFENSNDERRTMITLTISSSTESMSFVHPTDARTDTVVHVGRRPSSHGWTAQPTQALFRCAVVSRHHAQFIITNNGAVYVQDTSSHHGTYIGPSFQIVPPNVRTLVSDGDMLTFGKSVGKDEDQVNPVVVTVSISRQEVVEPSSPIQHTTPTTPNSNTNTIINGSSNSSTGRYGLPASRSPSPTPEMSPVRDDDSIPSPTRSLDYGHAGTAIADHHVHVQTPSTVDPFTNCVVWSPSPTGIVGAGIVPSFAPFREYLNMKRQECFGASPIQIDDDPDHDLDQDHEDDDDNEHDQDQDHDDMVDDDDDDDDDDDVSSSARSSSSSRPSPSPSVEIHTSADNSVDVSSYQGGSSMMMHHHDEPVYPAMGPELKDAFHAAVAAASAPLREYAPMERMEECSGAFDRDQTTASYVVYPQPGQQQQQQYQHQYPHQSQADLNIDELKAAIASLEDQVKILDERRRHYRSRFNSNMHNVSRRFISFNQRVDDIWSAVTLIQNHVKAVLGDDSELEVRLRKLEDKVSDDERMCALEDAVQEALAKIDELVKKQEESGFESQKVGAVSLGEEHQEPVVVVKSAEEEAEDRRVAESNRTFLDNEFRRARFTFCSSADELEGHTEPCSPLVSPRAASPVPDEPELDPKSVPMPTSVPSTTESRKRKRVEGDNDHHVDYHGSTLTTSNAGISALQPTVAPSTTDDPLSCSPPPSKKLRRVSENATAFVLGAVAAWGALAFS